jgi:CheY-like chemotaxis protein
LSNKEEAKPAASVLVVEDEDSARTAIQKILENYGHKVVGAADGPEALGLFKSHGGFDIVFTDLSLPGISGWEVASAIRELSPDTPVVILSGWDIDAEGEEMKRSGAARVLSKPVMVKEMLDAVRELAGRGGKG